MATPPKKKNSLGEYSIWSIEALNDHDLNNLQLVGVSTIGELATALKKRRGDLSSLSMKRKAGDKVVLPAVRIDAEGSARIGDALLAFLREDHYQDPLTEDFDGWDLSNEPKAAPKPAPKPVVAKPAPAALKKADPKPVATKKDEFTPKPVAKKKGLLERLRNFVPGA